MPVFRITLNQLWRGQNLQNVLFFSDGGLGDTQSQIADKVQAGWVQEVKKRQVNELIYTSIKVQQLGAGIGPPFVKQIAIAGLEGASTRILTYSCFVLKTTSFAPGRKAFGRVFIGGHVDGAFVNGIIEVGQQNFWNNNSLPVIRSTFMGLTPSSGINWGVITGTDPSTFRSIEQVEIRSISGVQRRRNIGTGI